jgi:hypothetical protein
MSIKLMPAALLALTLTGLASAGQAAPRRPPDAAGAATGYQGEAPPWSFACMKDHGPTRCGEPMWIYGN